MITKLTAKNVKVPAFSHELKPVNIITGDNAVGKTARLDAIRILLAGKHPDLGSAAADTFTLSCGTEMSVDAETTKFGTLARSWKQGKSAVKRTTSPEDGFPETPAVLLNASDYLSKSEKERIRYVAGLVNMDESRFSGQAIVESIRRLDIEEPNKAKILAHEKIVQDIDDRDTKRHEEGESVQDWMEKLVYDYQFNATNARATVDRFKKSAEAAVQLAAQSTRKPTRNVDAELREAMAKLGTLGTELKTLRGRVTNVVAPGELSKMLAQEAELAAIPPTIPGLEKQREELRAIQHVSKTDKAIDARRNIYSANNELRADARRLEQEREKLGKAVLEDETTHCRCCGNAGEACQGAARRIGLAKERIAAIATEWEDIQKKLAANEIKLAEIEADFKAATAEDEADATRQRAINSLTQLIEKAGKAEGLLAKLRYEIEAAKAAQPPAASEVAEAEEYYRQQSDIVDQLTAMQKLHAAAQREEAQRVELQESLEAAEGELFVTKLVQAKLNAIHAEMVNEAFGSLVTVMNRVCSGILKSPLAYHEGELGRWDGKTWIPHGCFSGTEKAITYAAIGVALAQSAPLKIVMIDELARLTHANRIVLVETMLKLIEDGVIEQFIGVDLDPEIYRTANPEKLQVIAV